MPINGHNVVFIKGARPTVSAEYYALNESGELYLLEGAEDQAWLEEQEAAKYTLEETKPGQYQYVAEAAGKEPQTPALPLSLPTISLDATKLLASLAAAVSFAMYSM